MKYRYLITDDAGPSQYLGTNAIQSALDFSAHPHYIVFDAATGEVLIPDGSRRPVVSLDGSGIVP